jgi:Tol biopolymer transport system component
MMPADRLERQLPGLLDEVGETRTPDYFDDLLATTARTRQRPGWIFPGRWIPRLGFGREPLIRRPVPWRPILILVLMVLLVAAALAFVIGSRRTPFPAYGPARNGVIAYSFDGDIYTGDPVTGASNLIVANSDDDEFPTWLPDGSRFVFLRKTGAVDGIPSGQMFVADADGRNLTQVMQEPVTALGGFDLSADGESIALSSTVGGREEVTIASIHGAASRLLGVHDLLPVGLAPNGPSYRPYGGSEIMFAAWDSPETTSGIYVVNEDGSKFRELLEPTSGILLFHPTWSPDGSMIAYTRVPAGTQGIWELHIYTVDSGIDRPIHTSDAPSEGWPMWSPDGSRLLIQRSNPDGSNHVYAVVPSDGTGPGIEIQHDGAPIGANYTWAPDGTSILAIPDFDASKLILWDAASGATKTVPWMSGNFNWQGRFPSWQRLPPLP